MVNGKKSGGKKRQRPSDVLRIFRYADGSFGYKIATDLADVSWAVLSIMRKEKMLGTAVLQAISHQLSVYDDAEAGKLVDEFLKGVADRREYLRKARPPREEK